VTAAHILRQCACLWQMTEHFLWRSSVSAPSELHAYFTILRRRREAQQAAEALVPEPVVHTGS
jgi:hypothetical protein